MDMLMEILHCLAEDTVVHEFEEIFLKFRCHQRA